MSDHERVSSEGEDPLSDRPLLDLLDALVSSRGRVAAARALGVNYRTMMICYESRRVSGRMRRALEEFRDNASGDDDDVGTDGEVEEPIKRVAELEDENRQLRELVEAQAKQLEELERQAASLEEGEQPRGDAERADAGENQEQRRPRQQESGLADTWVVGIEKQAGEEDALGPAAPLVAEWRELRSAAMSAGNRVDRAKTAVRRWELEVELLRDFHLTLPPETEPFDVSRRADHIRWRLEALAEARRELARAKRTRLLRRVLTLGLWWR